MGNYLAFLKTRRESLTHLVNEHIKSALNGQH
jgi:hypothetical protein